MFNVGEKFRLRKAPAVLVIAWVMALLGGMIHLLRFEMTPGRAAAAENWPASVPLTLAADRPTFIMFLHPQCECSAASLEELNHLLTVCPNREAITLIFYKPRSEADSWVQTSLWKTAQSLPGVRMLIDPGGDLAGQFGAFTSGQSDLFDPNGRLLFTGGITGSRGHVGDNPGLDAVVSLIDHPDQSGVKLPVKTRVFGCAIRSFSKPSDDDTTQPSE
jgi:hypothetical protein